MGESILEFLEGVKVVLGGIIGERVRGRGSEGRVGLEGFLRFFCSCDFG